MAVDRSGALIMHCLIQGRQRWQQEEAVFKELLQIQSQSVFLCGHVLCSSTAYDFPQTTRGISFGTERHFWERLTMFTPCEVFSLSPLCKSFSNQFYQLPVQNPFLCVVCKHSSSQWRHAEIGKCLPLQSSFQFNRGPLFLDGYGHVCWAVRKNNLSHNNRKDDINTP